MSSRVESALAATLSAWVGALGMTAVAAATIFPTMERLAPSLPDYARYGGEHWPIAAGVPMQRIFAIFDGVQLVCCVASAGLAVAPVLRRGAGRVDPFLVARAFVVGLAFLGVAYYLLLLTPQMITDLRLYWEAARAGDTAGAESFRAAFEARHPTANRVLGAIGITVLAALVMTLAAPSRPRHG